MLIRRVDAAVLAGALSLIACGDPGQRATFEAPGSDITVVLERLPMHAFLAEYHRTLVLYRSRTQVARQPLFDDTGGYSRANLYRIDGGAFLLRDADASYTVTLAEPRVTRDASRRRAGTFVGSFDVGPARSWRFIGAGERPELPTEFRRG